jgi:hypothetical protein
MQGRLLLMSDQGSPFSPPLYLLLLIETLAVVAYVVAHTPTLHNTAFSTGSGRHISDVWLNKVADTYIVNASASLFSHANASCSAMPHVRPCQRLMFGQEQHVDECEVSKSSFRFHD